MKNTWLWFIVGALVLYWIIKNKAVKASPNAATAASATAPFWQGWLTKSDQAVKSGTDTIAQTTNAISSLGAGILGLFGGASKATGSPSPATSGGGSGAPTTDASAATPGINGSDPFGFGSFNPFAAIDPFFASL
jgi:hypothetical protein